MAISNNWDALPFPVATLKRQTQSMPPIQSKFFMIKRYVGLILVDGLRAWNMS
jgi:hypothetical protein